MRRAIFLLLAIGALVAIVFAQDNKREHLYSGPEEGLGRVHMDTSCSPSVSAEFGRAVALLHNFWYVRALERFDQVIKNDPECAMAYWGAAMSYNQQSSHQPYAA